MLKIEITIKQMSTDYFLILCRAMEHYGGFLIEQAYYEGFLLEQSHEYRLGSERKDHSILTEAYFKLERKISKKKLLESSETKARQNKSLKLLIHTGMVILDAINAYWPQRSFSETPALEHVKEQLSKQLL